MVYCAADVYSKGLFDSFSSAAAEYGVEVVVSESTASLDVQDYTNQFTSMVTAGVDFVYAPFYYDVIGPLCGAPGPRSRLHRRYHGR